MKHVRINTKQCVLIIVCKNIVEDFWQQREILKQENCIYELHFKNFKLLWIVLRPIKNLDELMMIN